MVDLGQKLWHFLSFSHYIPLSPNFQSDLPNLNFSLSLHLHCASHGLSCIISYLYFPVASLLVCPSFHYHPIRFLSPFCSQKGLFKSNCDNLFFLPICHTFYWLPVTHKLTTGVLFRSSIWTACILSRFSHVQVLVTLMDCSPPGSSVHGILQARILECVSMPPSRGSSHPRDWTHVSCSSCTAGRFFTTEHQGSPQYGLVPVCFFSLPQAVLLVSFWSSGLWRPFTSLALPFTSPFYLVSSHSSLRCSLRAISPVTSDLPKWESLPLLNVASDSDDFF